MRLPPLSFRSRSTQGLTVGELLLGLLVAAVILGGGWWVWQRSTPSAQPSSSLTHLPQRPA
ncbi:hypothetical protein [Synechococcus elongatus]|uniref:hypothetical protein n=1 Tax=Synechococcus elongatus TaxID=32046 RepID=UPI00031E2484|nr:hypothetical protein [Synechococcus elongatus]AJD58871.1 hypothetical protein M744_05080 [Synechococcus elongatus UTEX 2973]MBD2587002.1 hypothetical protein [Synechococcus elongatus FACHB-242]MBD2688073.1 hypothetical protein [Synechococcus elongatus FACHB-1061]MBD2706216.1 hypothetical protein [Synechococcus elongatus PCC 7942 = FACHB-805]UOW72078.1 TSUP family transporter [Synechococcus elongatus PCC 7943]